MGDIWNEVMGYFDIDATIRKQEAILSVLNELNEILEEDEKQSDLN